MKSTIAWVLITLMFCFASMTHADSFGDGANSFDIDFVTISNPHNPDDVEGFLAPAGKVDYTYRMGTYEISSVMIDKANALGDLGITRHHRRKTRLEEHPGLNNPATSITWFEAAKFVNWLNTSKGHAPAYKFNGDTFELWQPSDAGYDPANLFRNSRAFYFLPSTDEWYKAAYYDPQHTVYYDYPTGSDTFPDIIDFEEDPTFDIVVTGNELVTLNYLTTQFPRDITDVGVLSPYGTAGQAGNVAEWVESESDGINDQSEGLREIRGGSWFGEVSSSNYYPYNPPITEGLAVGFRVASAIPEPNTLLLVFMSSAALLVCRRW